MKKILILFAAVALTAMTACNQKPAKNNADQDSTNVNKVERIDQSKLKTLKNSMEKIGPTEDGKDHNMAKFKTAEYEVSVDNLANGIVRVTLKGTDGEQVYESKNCRGQDGGYLMRTTDGKNIMVNGKEGKIVILGEKDIIYKGQAE